MVVSMYVPALVVILNYVLNFKRNVFKNNDLGLRFIGMKYWLIAPIFLFIIIASTYMIPFLFNTDFFKNSTEILTTTEKTGMGVGHWFLNLVIIFSINTFVAPILNILMLLGEELAWRGFLFPRLLCLFGAKRSFVISGTIWSLWHAGGIMLDWNYPGHPLIGNMLMILLCIPMGLIFQYLYAKSRSIFVPALAHGAMNWTAGNFIMFVVARS
ncbi:MAG: CPBP family intramembrane metalloprotease [Flammeovirgaceae bacterium]|nr:CPBP family intramembrane metalloprotease [Flammeovirgaceae bacterium]